MAIQSQVRVVHTTDPKEVIWGQLRDRISNIQPLFNRLIIAVYKRVGKKGEEELRTAGGIIVPGKAVEDDDYQGKTGLVVAKGPTAYKDDGPVRFHGQDVHVGDWVLIRPSDGLRMEINERVCIMVQDVHIMAIVSEPDDVF